MKRFSNFKKIKVNLFSIKNNLP